MNRRVVKNMVNILRESPLYMELSSRERHSLLENLIDLCAALPDLASSGKRGGPAGQDATAGARSGRTN